MADNEVNEQVDDSEDDLLMDDGEPEEKKKGLSKPLLIKIAIGLVVTLLIAGGAYFFLMGDEAQLEEALVESEAMDDKSLTSDSMDSASEATIELDNLLEAPPESEQLEEQNEPVEKVVEQEGATNNSVTDIEDSTNEQDLMKIREDVKALQEENLNLKKQMGELGAPQSLKPSDEEVNKDTARRIEPMIMEHYSDSYQEGSRDYPYVRKPKQEPVPEPKWGD